MMQNYLTYILLKEMFGDAIFTIGADALEDVDIGKEKIIIEEQL